LRGRPCVAYIDNVLIRGVSISGIARIFPGNSLLGKPLEVEDAVGIISWFTRVLSQSNIADAPSRESLEGLTVSPLSPHLVGLVVAKYLDNLDQIRIRGGMTQ